VVHNVQHYRVPGHYPSSQWLRLAVSKGPNKIGASLPLPEDGNISSFQSNVFSSYLELKTKDKAHKPCNSEVNFIGTLYSPRCKWTFLGKLITFLCMSTVFLFKQFVYKECRLLGCDAIWLI
jgi:hypothetical protein